MNKIENSKWASNFCRIAETGGGFLASGAWLAIAFITVFDVIGRSVFSTPIYGAYEYVKMFMAIGIFLSIPSVVLRHRQVSVQMFSNMMSLQFQGKWANFGAVVGAGCFALIAYSLAMLTISNYHSGETTTLLQLPFWAISAFMCFMSCVIVLSCIVSLRIAPDDEE